MQFWHHNMFSSFLNLSAEHCFTVNLQNKLHNIPLRGCRHEDDANVFNQIAERNDAQTHF